MTNLYPPLPETKTPPSNIIIERVQPEIDGGVDRSNIEKVVAAGAEIIVAGSAIFGKPDAEAAVRELREATVQWV